MTEYIPIDPTSLPSAIRFDVPKRNQGQTVEYAYGGYDRAEHDDSAPFMRITDSSFESHSPERVRYYKRVDR